MFPDTDVAKIGSGPGAGKIGSPDAQDVVYFVFGLVSSLKH